MQSQALGAYVLVPYHRPQPLPELVYELVMITKGSRNRSSYTCSRYSLFPDMFSEMSNVSAKMPKDTEIHTTSP